MRERVRAKHDTTQASTAHHTAPQRTAAHGFPVTGPWQGAGAQLYKLGNEVAAASPASWLGPRQHPPRQSMPMGSVMDGSMHMHSAHLRLACT